MANTDKGFVMPNLSLRVFCVEPAGAVAAPSLPRAQNMTECLFGTMQQQQQWLVPLQSTQVICVGTVYPTKERQFRVSRAVGNNMLLSELRCTLDTSMSDLVFLAPALQVVVNYVRTDAQAAPTGQTTQATQLPASQGTLQGNVAQSYPDTAHIFTASLPLSELLTSLLKSETHIHTSMTSEDGVPCQNGTQVPRQWQLHVSLADSLTPAAAQQLKQQLASQIDAVHLHTALVERTYGFCESLQQCISYVSACRETRKQATNAVIAKLTQQQVVTSWELQMSRNFNTVVTAAGHQEPAALDNEQIQHLRVGAQINGQAQQTMLMFVNSLVSSIVANAQLAGVPIGYSPASQSALFDPLAVHTANHDFVTKYGVDELMHKTMYNCQQNICGRTQYGSDPAYGTSMQVEAAKLDAYGRGSMQVKPVVQLLPTSGEDQQVEIGCGPLATSRPIVDCEDSANTLACMASVMRAYPNAMSFQQAVSAAVTLFPADVQQMSSTILDMAGILWQNEAQASQTLAAGSKNTVAFDKLDTKALLDAVKHDSAGRYLRRVSTCSVLARAPQIGAAMQPGTTRDSMLVDMNTSLETFLKWWGDGKSNGLNGHSVCASVQCFPVLQTQVNGTPVHFTLLRDFRLYEGTGVAIQRQLPCTQQATLKVGNTSPQRMQLQQKLDSGVLLSSCMASSIKSALHTCELREKLQTAVSACKELRMPIVSGVQSYSLAGAAQTETQRQVMIQSMFYAVCLACDLGGVLSLDTRAASPSPDPASAMLLPGAPFVQGLLHDNVVRIVASSPSSAPEIQRLRALGAFMSLNTLDAQTYLQHAPASFTPLHLRQTMAVCPVRNCLVPLTASQLKATEAFTCGIFCSSPFVNTRCGSVYTTAQEVEANMHNLLTQTASVVGCIPVVTGAGFSDNMLISYS